MKAERISPEENQVSLADAARLSNKLEVAREKGNEKGERILRGMIQKRGERILQDAGINVHLSTDKQAKALGIVFDEEPHVRGSVPLDFEADAQVLDPILEKAPKLSKEGLEQASKPSKEGYVATQRIVSEGKGMALIYPDGHGQYPMKEDLHAALHHDLYLGARWAKEGIDPMEAALIAHAYRTKKTRWLHEAITSLLAHDPKRPVAQAGKKAARVIDDLIEMHHKRIKDL